MELQGGMVSKYFTFSSTTRLLSAAPDVTVTLYRSPYSLCNAHCLGLYKRCLHVKLAHIRFYIHSSHVPAVRF